MDTNSAIDLSLRTVSPNTKCNSTYQNKKPTVTYQNDNVPVVRPIPRPPWAIMWYQSLWAANQNHHHKSSGEPSSAASHSISSQRETLLKFGDQQKSQNPQYSPNTLSVGENEDFKNSDPGCLSQLHLLQQTPMFDKNKSYCDSKNLTSPVPVLDVACCDGPVSFERVSNPNFALTVEHNDSTPNDEFGLKSTNNEPRRHLALKTYLCIYCNQSFKSLFCYQKHKKRHLNPVSVDITATHAASSRCIPEKKAKTKDLNVQFFPCKKCGCKFPSYYFVHKHRKVCH